MKKLTLIFIVAFIVILSVKKACAWGFQGSGFSSATCFASDSSGTRLILGTRYAGVWMSEDSGESWIPINSRIFETIDVSPMEINTLDANADTIFLRSYSSHEYSDHFYSFDSGQTWQNLNINSLPDTLFSSTGFDILTIDQANHNNWYHANELYFSYSSDCGLTWHTNLIIENQRFAGYRKRGIYKDDNNQDRLYLTGNYFADPYGSGFYGGLLRSDDFGETWYNPVDLNAEFGITLCICEELIRLSNGNLYLPIRDVEPQDINSIGLYSDDDGLTWSIVERDLQNNRTISFEDVIECSGIPGRLLAISFTTGVLQSDDYGVSWYSRFSAFPNTKYLTGNIYKNSFSGSIYASISGYGAWKSDDNGENFSLISSPDILSAAMNIPPCITPEEVFVVDEANRIWRYTDENDFFEEIDPVVSLLDTMREISTWVVFDNGAQLRGIGNYLDNRTHETEFFVKRNDNIGWVSQGVFENYMWVEKYQDYEREFVISESDNSFFYSSDTAATWYERNYPVQTFMKEIFHGRGKIFISAFDHSEIYVTEDMGDNWRPLNYPGNLEPLNNVWLENSQILLTSQGSEFWTYFYSSDTWMRNQDLPETFHSRMIAVEPEGGAPILVLHHQTENLLQYSRDFGNSWDEVVIQYPVEDQIRGIQFMYYDEYRQRFWISCGMGVGYFELHELGVDDTVKFIPATFATMDVYPNPFNSNTRIKCQLPNTGLLKISMYDVLGREIRTIYNDNIASTNFEMNINSENLASGTYFINLKMQDVNLTKKIQLVK